MGRARHAVGERDCRLFRFLAALMIFHSQSSPAAPRRLALTCAIAPGWSRRRRYLLPIPAMRPSLSLPPVEWGFGVKPSQGEREQETVRGTVFPANEVPA